MVLIKRQVVSRAVAALRTYGGTNPVKSVTVHQTGNTNAGANAQAHANIQSRLNPRQASWHYSVDDKEAIQSFEDTAQVWAAGDGRGPGNLTSIHVEICINSDGDYAKAVQNGAELTKHLLDKHGLSVGDVKQHNDWAPKNCPAQIRAGKNGITWAKFLDMVVGGSTKVSTPKKTAVKSETTKKPANKANMTTGSVVEYLASIGEVSSFANRKKLAQRHGITNYSGTASQNTKLLAKLRGEASKPKAPAKKASASLPNATYIARKPYPNGSGVRAVQEALASVYFYPEKGAKNNGVDGYYGPATADAVKRFQSMHGLVADGIYGAKTRAALEKAMK